MSHLNTLILLCKCNSPWETRNVCNFLRKVSFLDSCDSLPDAHRPS